MWERRRKTLCLVAVTRETLIASASFRTIVPWNGQIGNPARLKLDESRSEIVSPGPKGPIFFILPSGPFHGCPNFRCALDKSGRAKGYLQPASWSNVSSHLIGRLRDGLPAQ